VKTQRISNQVESILGRELIDDADVFNLDRSEVELS
jgi:hypothetical protein